MQVAGTKVNFEWDSEGVAPAGAWVFHSWHAKIVNDTPEKDMIELVGKTVTAPDGILSRIRGIQTIPLDLQYADTPFILSLEAMERPF